MYKRQLKDCAGLKALSVVMCDEIKDFSAVSGLNGLETLHLDLPYGCPEPDLSGLSQLKELYLEGFQGMSFLRNMSGLELSLIHIWTSQVHGHPRRERQRRILRQ